MTFVSRTSWVLPRPRTELRMLPYSRPFTKAELGGTRAHARMATACPSSSAQGRHLQYGRPWELLDLRITPKTERAASGLRAPQTARSVRPLPHAADQAASWADAVLVQKVGSGHALIQDVLQRRRLLPVGATDRNPSERRAFGTLSKWPCDRMKPASVEHKVNDGARAARTDVSDKVWCFGKNYDADTIT